VFDHLAGWCLWLRDGGPRWSPCSRRGGRDDGRRCLGLKQAGRDRVGATIMGTPVGSRLAGLLGVVPAPKVKA
jgi:hypothetical protein